MSDKEKSSIPAPLQDARTKYINQDYGPKPKAGVPDIDFKWKPKDPTPPAEKRDGVTTTE